MCSGADTHSDTLWLRIACSALKACIWAGSVVSCQSRWLMQVLSCFQHLCMLNPRISVFILGSFTFPLMRFDSVTAVPEVSVCRCSGSVCVHMWHLENNVPFRVQDTGMTFVLGCRRHSGLKEIIFTGLRFLRFYKYNSVSIATVNSWSELWHWLIIIIKIYK